MEPASTCLSFCNSAFTSLDSLLCNCTAGHNYIGTEHILLGLLREGEGVAARVLETLGADPSKIRTQVPSFLRLLHICLPCPPLRVTSTLSCSPVTCLRQCCSGQFCYIQSLQLHLTAA